jgi:hypothetical protein
MPRSDRNGGSVGSGLHAKVVKALSTNARANPQDPRVI